MPLEPDVALAVAERHAGRDAQLLAHDIDAADHLADRVLDLQPRVHLDEVERSILVEKLHRSGTAVAELLQRGDGHPGQSLPRRIIERGGGGFLKQLLVRTLQRAVALAEMDRAALAVADQLHLDMARPVEKAFEIDRVVAEGGSRLGLGQGQLFD